MTMGNGGIQVPAWAFGKGTKGHVRVTRLDLRGDVQSGPPGRSLHRTRLVPGRNCAMADNDLRGFLDGGFYLGWNQPEQFHVRAGRDGYGGAISASPVGEVPRYGEHELFRFLQRWDLSNLPRNAKVEAATLEMRVETACEKAARVAVYRVFRDWEPGRGGVEENSISVPKTGEVWWLWARHEEEPWSLPGAGHPGDAAEGADTAPMPLAVAEYEPGDSTVRWSDERLTEYVSECVQRGEPLRLLFKLSDYLEDVPGIQLSFYSADCGGHRDDGFRPELEIEWSVAGSGEQDGEIVFPVHLEAGRTHEFHLTPLSPGSYWVELAADDVFEAGAIAIATRDSGGFQDVPHGASAIRVGEGGPATVRVTGGITPIDLGDFFEDELRHTWVIAGPPEDQAVEWLFESPTGRVKTVPARYAGRYVWAVRFTPDEVGRWRFRWRHHLMNSPREGPPGFFDVVGRDREVLKRYLEDLHTEIEENVDDLTSPAAEVARVRFVRLQRALVRTLAGVGIDPPGRIPFDELAGVRSLLWGRPMPEEIPLTSMPLVREMNGRTLADPIPFHPEPESWVQQRVGLLRRFVRRVARRLRSLRGVDDRSETI